MNKLSGARRRSRREILALDEANAEASSDGVQGDAATSGATADDENVQGVSRAGSDQSRLLDRPRRNDGLIGDPLPDSGESRSATAVVGGERGLVQDECAAGRRGDRGGGAEPAQASGGGHGGLGVLERESESAMREKERKKFGLRKVALGIGHGDLDFGAFWAFFEKGDGLIGYKDWHTQR